MPACACLHLASPHHLLPVGTKCCNTHATGVTHEVLSCASCPPLLQLCYSAVHADGQATMVLRAFVQSVGQVHRILRAAACK